MKKKRLFSLLAVGAIVLAGCSANQVEEKAGDTSENEVVKIGFISPLTGGGAAYGQDIKAGVDLYFSENPTIDGKKVEVIYEDGKCNGQDAVNAGQKLINIDKVQVIIGGTCSGETLAVAPIAEQNKVALLSPGSSSPDITTAGDYVFRVYPSDSKVAQTLVDAVAPKHEKIALLTEQTDYAQGYRSAVKNALSQYEKSKLAVDEAYAVDNTDFRTLLTKVKEAGATALISVAQTPAGHGFTVKQAKELGLDVEIYGTDTMDGPDYFETAKDAAEGTMQAVVAEDPSRDGYAAFVERISTPQSSPIFQALAYDAAAITAQAIAEVGYDGTKIKDYWYGMDTYVGLGGDHKFDENGDNLVPAAVKTAKDGKFHLPSAQ